MASKKKIQNNEKILNIAIAILGIFFIGFIYSFSQQKHNEGSSITINSAERRSEPILAKDIYKINPIKNIKVEVLNGCGEALLASKTTDFLRSKMIDVVKSDNADHYNYQKTLIIQRNENFNSFKKITKAFGIQPDDIRVQIIPDESLGVDVTIIIGKDYSGLTTFSKYLSVNY